MAIEKTNEIDLIAIDGKSVYLVIIDEMEWVENEDINNNHMYLLQEKINTCLANYETKELFEIQPEAKGKDITIKIISKNHLNDVGIWFLEKARLIINSVGIKLIFEWYMDQ